MKIENMLAKYSTPHKSPPAYQQTNLPAKLPKLSEKEMNSMRNAQHVHPINVKSK